MKNIFRKALVISILAFAAFGASAGSIGNCGLSFECEVNYYSDPAHTQQVGFAFYACGTGAPRAFWGQATGYFVVMHTASCEFL